MVISSLQEGGANVVSEAIVAGVPVIASDIAGNRGLLGQDYPGYYAVGETGALANLLHRAETDRRVLQSLSNYGQRLAPLFEPLREQSALEDIVNMVTQSG